MSIEVSKLVKDPWRKFEGKELNQMWWEERDNGAGMIKLNRAQKERPR